MKRALLFTLNASNSDSIGVMVARPVLVPIRKAIVQGSNIFDFLSSM